MLVGIIVLGIIFCFVISSIFIDYPRMLGRLYRDKPKIGHIYIDNGKGFEPWVKAERIYVDLFTEIFFYRWEGRKYEVRVGRSYPVKYIERGRMIFARPGCLWALPMPTGETERAMLLREPQFTEEQVGITSLSWGFKEWNESLRGKSQSFLIWILIGVIAIIAVVGVVYFTRPKAKTPVTTSTTTQTTIPSTTPSLTVTEGQ